MRQSKPTLKLTIIQDPFSREGRIHQVVAVNLNHLEVACFIPESFKDGNWKVVLASAGEVPESAWNSTKIDPHADQLIITPKIEDPATMAAVGAAIVAGTKATAAFLAANWLTVASFAITAGTAIYSIATAKKPAFSGENDASSASPTYGWDGVQTTSDVDIPVPVIYGENLVGGNLINVYVDNKDDQSVLHALLAIGEGPLTEISGISADTDDADIEAIGSRLQLEGNPVTNYENIKVAVRMGGNDQTPIPGFGQLHQMRNFADNLAQDDPYTLDTQTERPVDAVRINFRVDSLFKSKASGFSSQEIRVKIEYKPVDSEGDYTTHGYFTISGKYFSAVRRSYDLEFPARDAYRIRMTKVTGDSDSKRQRNITLVALDEIVKEELAYPNTALIGLEIVATDQLSGSLSSVQARVKGLAVDVWDDVSEAWVHEYSRNPVWCILDAIRNPYYGAGKFIEEAHLNLERFKTEAAYCDEQVDFAGTTDTRFLLDIVIDAKMTAYDALNKIGLSCNAILCWSSTAVQPVIDRPAVPQWTFTEGSIRNLQIEYKSLSKTKNRVEIQYPNAALSYRRDLVQAVDMDSITAGDPDRIKTLFVPGITRACQAEAVASYLVLSEKYIDKTIAFETGAKGVFCEVGDLIELSTQLTQWGVLSGRITGAGNEATAGWFTALRDLTVPAGSAYTVRVAFNDGQRVDKILDLTAGTYTAGTRLYIQGLWDTPPAAFDEFAIGDQDTLVRPFRIMSMKRGNDAMVAITAVYYDERVYDRVDIKVVTPEYTAFLDPRRIPASVTSLVAYNVSDGDPRIAVAWQNSADDTGTVNDLVDHYEIWSSTDGIIYALDGLSNGSSYVKTNILPGAAFWFKVLAVSHLGRKSSLDAAQSVQIVARTEAPPPNVEGLELFGQGNAAQFTGRDAKFTWRETSYASGTDLLGERSGLGAGSGALDRYFQDYRIEIWVDGLRVRTEAVAKNEYIYTGEKNAEDNGGAAARAFTIKVWARDIFNRASQTAATLAVSNPAPAAPGGVTARASYSTFFVSWDPVADLDLSGYQVRRGLTAGFAWEDGEVVYEGPSVQFTMARLDADPLVSTYYFRVGAFDAFGKTPMNCSGVASATTGSVPIADLEQVPFELSRMFTNIPVPVSPGWQGNAVDTVSWADHVLYYQGVQYAIAAGSTPAKYIYWIAGTNYYLSSATPVTGAEGYFTMATNVAGVYSVAIGVIANQLIGSAYIADAAIGSAKIQDAAITSAKIEDAAITNAKINDLSAGKITAGDIAAARMQVNAGAAVNAGSTAIEPGKVQVSGPATLADWRDGADATKISGGAIAANTIQANALTVGMRGILADGIFFRQNETAANQLDWTAGNITWQDDNGDSVINPVTAGNAVWSAGVLYIYWAKGASALSHTTDRAVAFGAANVPLAAYRGGSAIDARLGRTEIIGEDIRTGTIAADQIDANAVTADKIAANAVTAGKIAADAVTANEISVSQLSALAADLGSITGGSVTLALKDELGIATTRKMRINDSGIMLSLDGGSTWRDFLIVDSAGDFVVSFDFLASGAQFAEVFAHYRVNGSENKITSQDVTDLYYDNTNSPPMSASWTSDWFYSFCADEFLRFFIKSMSVNENDYTLDTWSVRYRIQHKSDSAYLYDKTFTDPTLSDVTPADEILSLARLGLNANGTGDDPSGWRLLIDTAADFSGAGALYPSNFVVTTRLQGAKVEKLRITKD